MSVRLTFEKMKKVSSEVFGLDLHRSGSRFRLSQNGEFIGWYPGCGSQFSLENIRDMFQDCLNDPEAIMYLRKELREALTA